MSYYAVAGLTKIFNSLSQASKLAGGQKMRSFRTLGEAQRFIKKVQNSTGHTPFFRVENNDIILKVIRYEDSGYEAQAIESGIIIWTKEFSSSAPEWEVQLETLEELISFYRGQSIVLQTTITGLYEKFVFQKTYPLVDEPELEARFKNIRSSGAEIKLI